MPGTLNAEARIYAQKQTLSDQVLANHSKKGMQILGVLKFGNVSDSTVSVAELSGIAWDADEQLLYAVSDKGQLVHLQPEFEQDELVNLVALNIYTLQDKSGKPLTGDFIDSEGLEAVNQNNGKPGDTELLISFERIPRIVRYSVQGELRAVESIPAFLTSLSNYRNPNTSLESITLHARYGILTAPEKLASHYPLNQFQIFSLSGYRHYFRNSGGEFGSITGMTVKDDDIFVLERIFENPFFGIRFALHKIEMHHSDVTHTELFRIGPEHGYFSDNFEAITHLRDNRFLMISDDNNNALQRALLVHFKILNPD